MGSLLRRSLHLAVNKILRTYKPLALKRLQQTHAALSSINETQQPPSNNVIPIFRNAIRFGDKTALRDLQGDYTYRGLFLSSRQFSNELSDVLNGKQQERVAFLLPNDARYVIVQWACWMSGQIAVPLNATSPPSVLNYYLKDSDAKVIITTSEHVPVLEPLVKGTDCRLMVFDDALRVLAMKPAEKSANNKSYEKYEYNFGDSEETSLKDEFYNESNAMFVYTSGTTGVPKGVVMSHRNLQSQMNALITAWKWSEKDIVLHTLPLNHVHGIVNVLMCPLYVGARCVMLPKFETSNVWTHLLGINLQNSERCNMFMAVPTIYMKLIQEYEQLFSKNAKMKEYVQTVCSTKIRLMVSGSAPLPKPIFDRWEEITGHRLLERYGMTETGMVLSNPLEGQRIPGTVGTPLPGVHVRLTKEEGGETPEVLVEGSWAGTKVIGHRKGPIVGDLQVKGESVFREYWKKPEATAKEFTKDGWFKTGDTAQYDKGVYSILGRSSVDIIKTGGYKVSALQVETAILGHPDIIDCAVVGLPDITWGEKVAAVVVTREGAEIILSQLREFGKKSLPEYAVPTVLKVVDKIPKNSMGKVNKPDLLAAVFPKNQI
ncbi:acyl-CoA synthetase family member 3, mitochondrial [Diachasma alloeum]|uniref:acyl-CoA synthetase family member 3, mitochondrial n=1 Tax=Diachasma alloeum TaxID=454923 RepID=UPI0007385066|nr:acyl-CoA synthetase family member 3, mitochondrial [Diachasma alloeum]